MKLSPLLVSAILVALTAASTVPEVFEREALKACSGERKESDVCQGERLRKQDSFHNCGNQNGKCCAKDKDGSKGAPAGGPAHGCGYCFSGKCKG